MILPIRFSTLPLFELRYDLFKKSSLLSVLAGFNYAILLDNKVTISNENNESLEIGRTSSLTSNDVSLNTSINLIPQLSDRWFLNVESLLYYQPFRYKENSIRSGLDLHFKVGLEYKFQK